MAGQFLTGAVLVASLMAPQAMSKALAQSGKQAREARLVLRVDTLWKAWKSMNLHGVFLLYAPSYRRTTTEVAFMEYVRGMLAITPVDYRIVRIEIFDSGRRARVELDAHTDMAPVGRFRNQLVQYWTLEAGDWYRTVDPPSSPSPADGQPAAIVRPLAPAQQAAGEVEVDGADGPRQPGARPAPSEPGTDRKPGPPPPS